MNGNLIKKNSEIINIPTNKNNVKYKTVFLSNNMVIEIMFFS